MTMGRRRREQQDELWLPTQSLPTSPGHPFYRRLNGLLAEAGFDTFVESLCEPHYAKGAGRPSIPPGVYFRMLFIGYFEGLDSQRGIAWRCHDSRSLQEFLGYRLSEATPDHSSLSHVRERLPQVVHEQVFAFVLKLAGDKKLLKGQSVGVDSTTLEANAAMKTIQRKDTGEDYKTYLTRLAQQAGIDNPTDEDLRRFDKKRTDKKVSNAEWQSQTDADSRITKMKDGTTHLAYKAEHVVDLDTNVILAAEVYSGDAGDADTLVESVATAQVNMIRADSTAEIRDVAADKGYHKAETLVASESWGWRTYIPEKKQRGRRRWHDKPMTQERAYRANRRRTFGARSKRLQRKRSEYVERTFAHVCETGGARRTWLRGLAKVCKRYLIQAVAHNLGRLMRKLFGQGTPRGLQGLRGTAAQLFLLMHAFYLMVTATPWRSRRIQRDDQPASAIQNEK